MNTDDVYRWEFTTRKMPWNLANITGHVVFGWQLEGLSCARSDSGMHDVEMTWRRRDAYMSILDLSGGVVRFKTHQTPGLADLLHLGSAWIKSHKLDLALYVMACVTLSVFLWRGTH